MAQATRQAASRARAGGRATDPQNFDLDYGNVAFTRRHRFLSTFVYDLPVGKGKALLGGANRWLDGSPEAGGPRVWCCSRADRTDGYRFRRRPDGYQFPES